MVSLNPLDVFLWTFRRSESDVVNLYSSLSPVMQIATGGSMLNFGYWSEKISEPISAQENLCKVFGDMSELSKAKNTVDVGSGLGAPSAYWQKQYPELSLFSVNINFQQLQFSGKQNSISLLNSTATKLPFAENSVDRVLALESSQHFKPFENFISESKRILNNDGLLCLAIPVTLGNNSLGKLGILKFTWSSEHYGIESIREIILKNGFKISDEQMIGNHVYEPLADYYLKNRDSLRKLILQNYPQYVESILFKSLKKMKQTSEEKIIDYALLKCTL